MAEFCPNKRSKEFQELSSIFGEDKAYFLWMRNKGNHLEKAPNGADSKLFRSLLDHFEGDRIKTLVAKSKTYTNEFFNWFGNWVEVDIEKDFGEVSKVVDENGEPLVVYHGSRDVFSEFINDSYEDGIYFSDDKQYTEQFGNINYPVYLNIKTPNKTDIPLNHRSIEQLLTKDSIKGQDGIIGHDDVLDIQPSTGTEYVVLRPKQIKHIENLGTFSKEDDNMYHNLKSKQIKTPVEIKTVLEDILRDYFGFRRNIGLRIPKKYGIKPTQRDVQILINLEYAFGFPKGTIRFSKNSTDVVINQSVIANNIQQFKNKINHSNITSALIKVQLVDFLSSKIKGLNNNVVFLESPKWSGMQKDGQVYLNLNASLDIAAEECLHPFIEALYDLNRPLFDNLLKEARLEFKELRAQIAKSYKDYSSEARKKELVTQALARHFSEVYEENNGLKEEKSIWQKAWNWILDLLGLGVERLPKDMTLRQLSEAIFKANDIKIPEKYFKTEQFNLNQGSQSQEDLLEHFYPIGYTMSENRDIFIQDYLQHVQEIAPLGPLGKYIHSNSARETWDKNKHKEVVAEARKKLADAFGLREYLDQKTGRIIYTTEDTSADAQLRVEFVNSIGEHRKGRYTDRDILDSQMSLIEIAVLDGDPTTFVHELAHHYIRTFWKSEPVQQALKECGIVGKDKSVDVEERLVDALVSRLYGEKELKESKKNLWNKFWDGLKKVIDRVVGQPLRKSDTIKQSVIDTLAAHFAINKDLSDLQAEQEFFIKELVPVYQSGAITPNEEDKSLLTTLANIISNRIKSAEHASNYTPQQISSMRIQRNDILRRSPDNEQDIYDVVENLIAQCNKDLSDLAIVLANARTNGIQNLDIKSMMQLKIDVLGYYQNVFSERLLSDRFTNSKLPGLQQGTFLRQQFDDAIQRLSRFQREFDSILANYIDHTIDVYADYLMDFGDPEVFKQNMKYWARNQIQNGGLSMLEKYLGSAITSRSPIIRLMDYMVREAKGVIQRDALTKAHQLQEVWSKLRPAGSDLFTLKNYMKNFIELDEDGQPTGNFIREYNYGLVQRDINNAKVKIANKLGITLDDNLNPSKTDPKYNQFADELDDWYEKNPHIIRRYKPAYYKARRRYLSQDTIEYRNDLQSKIDNYIQKMTDPVTGVQLPSRLTANEQNEYRQLLEEKQNLSSFYIIQKDSTGKIIRFDKKQPGTDEYRMAQELSEWNNYLKGFIKYKSNYQRYNDDLQKLINAYGANSIEVASFKNEFTATRISQHFYDLVGQSASNPRLQDLYSRRASIINSVKGKSGYYMPNLSLLNDEAWTELKLIDEKIASLQQGVTGSVNQAFVDNARKDWVKHFENGSYTNENEINFLENEARRNSQVNPNALQQFYDKYYYTNAKGKQVPLSAFTMTVVNQTANGVPLVEYNAPIGRYMDLDDNSLLVDDRFDTTDRNYVQPWKDKSSKYYNKNWSKIESDQKMKDAYDLLISTMREAISLIPGLNQDLIYQLPQMRDSNIRRWARHGTGRLLGNIALKIGTLGITDYESLRDIDINETNTQYNEEFAKRPDGTYVTNIPLRWISKLNDPRDVSTDIFSTVAIFYEMAKNYNELQKIEPVMDAFLFNMKGGFAAGNSAQQTDQTERLENYIDMYIHGRMRKGFATNAKMSKQELRMAKLADSLMERTHSKLMGHNWRTVLKNAIDSGWNLTKEIFGGKYFTVKDAFRADRLMASECIKGTFGNLGRGNTKSFIGALMQYNSVEGSIKESFEGQRNSWIRRVLSKHLNMGEYTLVDYTFKGKITAMVYSNHRLLVNPNTGLEEFMNQEQAIYQYVKAGKSEKEAVHDWSNANTTLLDAYELSKRGNIVLKKNYEDIVRPYVQSLGRRSNKLETRISTIIKERSAVINGVLDSMDKSSVSQNYLGAMAIQMRGWMISQSLDNFKSGNDFGDYYSKLGGSKSETVAYNDIEDLKELRGQANLSTGYLENGAQRGLFKAYKNAVANILHLNRILNSAPLTRQQRYQIRMMNVSLISFAATIALGILFGKMVEDDDDDNLRVFSYAVNTGALQETTSRLPYGVGISALELLRSLGAVTAMYNDMGSIFDLAGDGVDYMQYQLGWSADTASNDEITRGAYQGLQKWQKDFLKASSVLTPDLSANNIYKNLSSDANMASARWYNQQFPVNYVNYIPHIGSTKKTNFVTNMFNDYNIYENSQDFWDYTKDFVFSPMER